MKKFLSVIFMALCGITAIHAGNPQTVSEEGVKCDATVTMTADPKPHYHFTKWVMTAGTNTQDYTEGSGDGYSCTTGDDLVNTLIITLSSSMINNAQNGEITFKAIFAEDDKYNITISAVDENGNPLGVGDYTIVSTTIPENYAGETTTLQVAEVASSCYVFDHWSDAATNGSDLGRNMTLTNATYGTADKTYYAVYKRKTVKINVTTDDDDMGTVTISVANPQ